MRRGSQSPEPTILGSCLGHIYALGREKRDGGEKLEAVRNGGNLLGEIAYTCTLTKSVLAANTDGFKVGQESDCTV